MLQAVRRHWSLRRTAVGLVGAVVLSLVWYGILSDYYGSLRAGLDKNLPALGVSDVSDVGDAVDPLSSSSSSQGLRSSAHVNVVTDGSRTWPYRTFRSSPWKPPNISIPISGPGVSDGYLLYCPKTRGKGEEDRLVQEAAWIMKFDGDLVFGFNDSAGYPLSGLRVQELNGSSHLTVWRGPSTMGHGFGDLVVLDGEYRMSQLGLGGDVAIDNDLSRKNSKRPGDVDFHEAQATPWNTMLVTAYNVSRFDLRALRGLEEGYLASSLFFEVDVATGDVIFSWDALDHFTLEDSRLPLKSYMGKGDSHFHPYDFFHINSVEAVGRDHFLISSRHMWACYLISRADGSVVWTLDGSGEEGAGDFGPLPASGRFRWQHHARAHNVGEESMDISLFDNHHMEDEPEELGARGLVLRVDLPPDSSRPPVVVDGTWLPIEDEGEHLYVGSQGSFETELGGGNSLIGYGPIPLLREYDSSGQIMWEGRFGWDNKVQNYRAFKSDWHATPRDWNPELVVEGERGAKGLRGYVSWNGATDVEAWNVYVGEGETDLELLGQVPRRGFETAFELASSVPCVRVGAVQDGAEVRASNVYCL